MYNIDIICVGKLKEDYLRGACAEYSKRLSAFCKLKITELTPAPHPGRPVEGADRLGSRGRGKAHSAAHSPVGARLRDVH